MYEYSMCSLTFLSSPLQQICCMWPVVSELPEEGMSEMRRQEEGMSRMRRY